MNTLKSILIIVIIMATALFSSAQDVEEIIAKHIEAHGGLEKWEAVKSMKITGRFTAFSIEKEFTAYKTSDGAYFGDLWLGKFPVKEAFNGKIGWTDDPWQELDFIRKVNKAEVNVFQQKAEFFTPFFNLDKNEHRVEYLGKENIEGTDVFVLKLMRKTGFDETWYLDASTYLEFKCVSIWADFAYQTNSEVYFDDFRDVDGLIIPFYNERTFSSRNRMIELENIELNVEIDPIIFEMPRAEEMKKLEIFEGEWNVTADVFTRRGTWYRVDSVNSNIIFSDINLLEENISYERILPVGKKMLYSYNSWTDKYRLAMYSDFGFNISLYEGNFNDTALILDNVNISYGDSVPTGNLFQYIFYDLKDDSYVLEIKRSTDEGATWSKRDKFVYTRKQD